MKVKIRNIPKTILDAEHLDTWEDFVHLLEEAKGCKALAFFNIDYDETRDTVEIPDVFDYEKAQEIISTYLAYHEEEILVLEGEPYDYDLFTSRYRGADDGTFDYAGTFMQTILSVLQELAKEETKNGK